MADTKTTEKHSFQAEVAKLLDIVVHSLYSNKEIFLRELISNASDSCDKLRYAAIAEPKLTEDGGADFAIHIALDKGAGTLTIADNGMGMNHDDLVENLGTIAKSGTQEFMKNLTGDESKDVSLIGQFGVGFYSSFMVAKKVEVFTRKAGEDQGWCWTSDGKGTFKITETNDVARGAKIVLHLRKDSETFLDEAEVRRVVQTYSDHIALPVILDGAGEDGAEEKLNEASALWTRSKSDITDEQYEEFYHHVSHAYDHPWHTIHYKAEGAIEYTALLYIPETKPFDLFQPERKSHVKLYVNRVYISDGLENLLPPYMRFMRGVIDSSDLPLNVSREMLQDNPVLKKIQNGVMKRILKDLKDKAKDKEAYGQFWKSFGQVFKEGLYEDHDRRDDILDLCLFPTTDESGLTSMADYVSRMKEGQEAIYYLVGEDVDALRRNPKLEGFKAKGVEVLLLADAIDEFWMPSVGVYEAKPFRNAGQSASDLGSIDKKDEDTKDEAEAESKTSEDITALAEKLGEIYGEAIKEVRVSDRLTESACVLVTEGHMSLQMEKMLKAQGQGGFAMPRVLEINPDHGLITALASQAKSGADIEDTAHLLLDQARIIEGEELPDPIAFARRLSAAMEQGLS